MLKDLPEFEIYSAHFCSTDYPTNLINIQYITNQTNCNEGITTPYDSFFVLFVPLVDFLALSSFVWNGVCIWYARGYIHECGWKDVYCTTYLPPVSFLARMLQISWCKITNAVSLEISGCNEREWGGAGIQPLGSNPRKSMSQCSRLFRTSTLPFFLISSTLIMLWTRFTLFLFVLEKTNCY